jgi:hypothetical protein
LQDVQHSLAITEGANDGPHRQVLQGVEPVEVSKVGDLPWPATNNQQGTNIIITGRFEGKEQAY